MTTSSTLTTLWLERAREFTDFVSEYKRMPIRTDGSVGIWRYNQLRNASAERRQWLDEHAPGWSAPLVGVNSGVWLFRVQELADFVAEHGRMPHQTKDGAVGARLKVWRRTGQLSSEQQRHLDEQVPGWRPTRSVAGNWLFRVQELADFVAEHGRMPHQTKDGAVGARLKVWRRTGQLSSEQQRHLDEQVPGWRPTRSVAGKKRDVTPRVPWAKRAQDVLEFVKREGQLPGRSEKPLGTWLSNQRNNPELSNEREDWLDENLPGWRAPGQDKKDQYERSQKRLVWLRTLTELPSIGTIEHELINSLSFSRTNKETQAELRRLGAAPVTYEQRATLNLRKLSNFVKLKGRLPREYKGIAPAEEIALAQFVRRCRRAAGSNPQRDKFMDKHAPGWLEAGNTPTTWDQAIADLEAFVTQHGRLPERNEGAVGRRLQRWRGPSQMTHERAALLDQKFPLWRQTKQSELAA